MKNVKKLCITALCIALCCVLPTAFHGLGKISSVLSPMHLPVLLCGLVCGWPWGAVCGAVGPLLSSLITSMPPAAKLFYMVPELVAYGLFSGLFMKFIRTGSTYADLYLSLVPSMLLGRVVAGIIRAFYFLGGGAEYSWGVWVNGYFVTALPALILQLALLPTLVFALIKSGVIPSRYPKK